VQRQQRQAKRRTESLFPDADSSQALANGPSSSAEPGAASKGAADGVDAYGGDDGDDGNWPDEEGGWDIGGGDEQDGGAGAGPRAPAPAPIVPVPVPVLLLPVLPVLPLPAPRVPVFVPGVTPEGAGSALTLSSPGYVVLLWASMTPHVKVMARLANRMRKRGE
jgi:hypothetical protein